MKKLKWAVLTAALVGMVTVPASASKLTINGSLTNYWTYEDSNLEPNSLLTNAKLNVKLGFTEGDITLKLNVPFKLDSFGTEESLISVFDDGWYLDLNTSLLNLSFSDAKDDLHKFEPVNDPMGLGNNLFDHVVFKLNGENNDSVLVKGSSVSDINFINSELFRYTSIDSEFPNYMRLTVDPDILGKVYGSAGSFNYVGYYAKSDVNYRIPEYLLDMTNPYGVGEIEKEIINGENGEKALDKKLIDDIHTFILRGTMGIGDNVKIGATATYLHYGDNIMEIGNGDANIMLPPDKQSQNLNFGLDVTGNIPVIGGNFAIAGAATAQVDGADKFEYVKDGHAFSVELSDIPVGIFKFGANFAGSQKNAFSPLADRDSIMHTQNAMKLGAEVGTVIDIQGVKLNLDFTDTVSGVFFKEFNENVAKLTASVKPSNKYSLSAAIKNEYSWKEEADPLTSIEFAAKGKVNDNLQLNGDVEFGFGNNGNIIANAYAIYDSELPASQHVQSSNVKVAGLLGYNGYNETLLEMPVANTIFYKVFAGFDTQITDKVSAKTGVYLGKGVLNSAGMKMVGSVTAEYEITPAMVLSGTYTYRNWGEFSKPQTEEEEKLYNSYSNHFANIALAVKASENTSIKLSWGNNGLAKSSTLKYDNVMPWSYLEINPKAEYRTMKTDALRLDSAIEF